MVDTRALMEKFAHLIEQEHFVEAFSMLNEDGKYVIVGTTKASGVYHGRADLLDRLMKVLTGFVIPPKVTFSDFVVDGDKGFLRGAGSEGSMGVTGPYRQPYYGWYVRAEGDGFAEMIEFLDPNQLETALFGKKLVDAQRLPANWSEDSGWGD
jgi:hypothetical protein